MVEKIFLTGKEFQPHHQFWKTYFTGSEDLFSFRQKNGKAADKAIFHYTAVLPDRESEILYRLVREDDSGVFVCVLAALGIVLGKYSGQERVVVNSPVFGEGKAEYVQDIPLIMETKAGSVLKAYLNTINTTVRACYSYQDLPVEAAIGVATERMSNVLARYEGIHSRAVAGQYDLVISISRKGKGIGLQFDYEPGSFDPFFIHNLCAHLTRVVACFENLETILGDIGIMGEEEKDRLIRVFNDTKRDYPPDETVITLFERYARETPESIALVYGGLTLTYAGLNEAANRLAGHLRRNLNVRENDIIGLMVENSERMIIGILAILKAGGTYLPIDPDLPDDRKRFFLSDAAVRLLLSDSTLFFQQSFYSGAVYLLDIELEGLGGEGQDLVGVHSPSTLAYIIYTSGTTGLPKGVMIGHRGVMNMIFEQMRIFGLRDTDKVLQFASISFDASVSEIFTALCVGGQLVLPDRSLIKDSEVLLRFMKEAGVSVLTLPPSYLSVIHWEQLTFLRVIISAGEKLMVKPALALSRHLDYFNAYGPTENSVCVSINKLDPALSEEDAESIGSPISNVQVYILSPDHHPVPVGVAGEIYVGGAGLAGGYLHRAELTAEKFIPNPFSQAPGARLYRTGDFGRWTPEGKILFLGRRDDQVKLRGYRVELGEIEQVLLQHAPIRQCMVLIKGDEEGNGRLIAFVVATGPFSKKEAMDYLHSRLPEYMIPALWMELNEMPLTSNGKVDKKALLGLGLAGMAVEEHSGPRNPTEEKLEAIWKEVFKMDQVSIYKDFFDLGGDSLLAIRVLSYIREEFGLNIPMNVLFQSATISDLAEYIAAMASASDPGDDKESEILLL